MQSAVGFGLDHAFAGRRPVFRPRGVRSVFSSQYHIRGASNNPNFQCDQLQHDCRDHIRRNVQDDQPLLGGASRHFLPGSRRSGLFRASEGLDSRLAEEHQPPQVVTGRHHRQRKVCARLTNRADQLATHLLDRGEYVLDTGAHLGNAAVAPLLALGQRFVGVTFALNPIPESIPRKLSFPRFRRIATVGVDVPARVAGIEDVVEMLAVVRAGGVGLEFADQFVFVVDVHRQLVAEVGFAVLLGPAGILVLLAPLGRFPLGRRRALVEQCLLAPAVVLLRRRYQRRVNDLATARDIALLEQLGRHAVEQRMSAGLADPVLEGPDRGAVGDINGVAQTAETLVTHTIEQLIFHLLVGQVVQPLEHQNPHHRFSRERWSAPLRADWPRRDSINLGRQGRKVNVLLDLGERVAELVDLLAVVIGGEQVVLDGVALFHRTQEQRSSGRCILPVRWHVEVFRGALRSWFCSWF